ncbi:hypothetical protein D9M73_150830 [compost metagenome]
MVAARAASSGQPKLTSGTSELPNTRNGAHCAKAPRAVTITSGATAAPPQAKKRSDGSRSPAARAASANSTRNGVAATVPTTPCRLISAIASPASQLSINTLQVPEKNGISSPLA